jgi:acetoin utilization protein AcuB
MRVQQMMTKSVETVSPADSVEVARLRMDQSRVRHLVVTQGRRVVGVVSDRDLRDAAAAGGDQAIADVMTSHVVTVDSHVTSREAANLLRGHGVSCLPVVDQGKLVGIVTTSDVLSALGNGTERPVERGKRWTLRHRGPRRITQAH